MKINGKPDGGGGGGVITELSVTSNGIYTAGAGVDGYSPIDVNVPSPEFVTEALNVSVNNTYYPGQSVDGFSQVIVDVPQSVAGFTEKEITEETYAIYNLNNSASFVHRNVFEGDNNLLTVYLPNASYVGSEAFKLCNYLTSVDMANCKIIYDSAFDSCGRLSQANFPECEIVSTYAFNNAGITTIDLPKCSVVEARVFQYCHSLQSVNLPTCKIIRNNAFYDCYALTSISVPHVDVIDGNVFTNCSALKEFTATCSFIGGGVFQNCKSLSYLNLSTVWFGGGNNMCNGCTSLEEIVVPMTYYLWPYSNMLVNTKIASGIGSIYVPDFLYDKYISATGWSSLSARMVSVSCPNTLLYSDGLLYGMTEFISYNFSVDLGIGYNSITAVDLPNLKYVSGRANYNPPTSPFTQCPNIQTISMGLSVLNPILCKALKSLSYASFVNCVSTSTEVFQYCDALTQVYMPNCEYVGGATFDGCVSLSSIDLPKCSHIGARAFISCAFTQVSLPLCEYIDQAAFQECRKMTSINLPVCSVIKMQAFSTCYSLTTVVLGSTSVCTLENTNAFGNISWPSIYVPASLVDAYKHATNWALHSDKIFPIPE